MVVRARQLPPGSEINQLEKGSRHFRLTASKARLSLRLGVTRVRAPVNGWEEESRLAPPCFHLRRWRRPSVDSRCDARHPHRPRHTPLHLGEGGVPRGLAHPALRERRGQRAVLHVVRHRREASDCKRWSLFHEGGGRGVCHYSTFKGRDVQRCRYSL